MALLGIVAAVAGLPVLLAPATVRTTFALRATPQMTYVLRIVGTMLLMLGLTLLLFAFVFWQTTG